MQRIILLCVAMGVCVPPSIAAQQLETNLERQPWITVHDAATSGSSSGGIKYEVDGSLTLSTTGTGGQRFATSYPGIEATSITYATLLKVDPTSNITNLEFDVDEPANGLWQTGIRCTNPSNSTTDASGTWEVADWAKREWVSTSRSCGNMHQWHGAWHRVQYHVERRADGTDFYSSIVMDGLVIPINYTTARYELLDIIYTASLTQIQIDQYPTPRTSAVGLINITIVRAR